MCASGGGRHGVQAACYMCKVTAELNTCKLRAEASLFDTSSLCQCLSIPSVDPLCLLDADPGPSPLPASPLKTPRELRPCLHDAPQAAAGPLRGRRRARTRRLSQRLGGGPGQPVGPELLDEEPYVGHGTRGSGGRLPRPGELQAAFHGERACVHHPGTPRERWGRGQICARPVRKECGRKLLGYERT